ncbi:hypothetical protein HNR00_004176 [Methylorubrum rhodinum]|uniref:Uncharacterized protein n=1 Tax=Methylorubrum rhodinum TaxID=29428 RepID=A0A840ZMN6_9HYPH|nr:hypothetical protein [Methylorubrum rhodinum]MBB5759442.1 hypothetical protein [Methylorubrum rhodinum]
MLEINSSPGIGDVLHPWSGEPQDVGAMLVAFLQRQAAAPTTAPAATASPRQL